jgi:rubrerythrin
MADDRDPLDDVGLATCPACLHSMEPVGDVREVVTDSGTLVEGLAYWRCPACGFARLA